MKKNKSQIAVIGGGYTGLTAAYELTKKGLSVTVIEKDASLGGLAGTFKIGGNYLEKFYHHWFTSDVHILELVKELGLESKLQHIKSKTGMFYNNNFFKLSKPLDLLLFKPLPFIDRLRLGFLTLYVRRIKNWKNLENTTAVDWLKKLGGQKVFEIVWLPLLKGKFGKYYKDISAVWFWNKLKLRGSSRNSSGSEELIHLNGGFQQIEKKIDQFIKNNFGDILLNTSIKKIISKNDKIIIVDDNDAKLTFNKILFTGSSHQFADILENSKDKENLGTLERQYIKKLRDIKYLGNVCLILELNKSLTDLYWVNVNDPNFPFVAVIEHTNFVSKNFYNNNNIIYLSKYMDVEDSMYSMSEDELKDLSIKSLKIMFKDFNDSFIVNFKVWRERFSQPIITTNYSQKIPSHETPIKNLYFSSMCQIYPEDRGTNYAVNEGKKITRLIISEN